MPRPVINLRFQMKHNHCHLSSVNLKKLVKFNTNKIIRLTVHLGVVALDVRTSIVILPISAFSDG